MPRTRYSPRPPIANTGTRRSSHAMLFTSTPLPPNRIAGRAIAHGTPVPARIRSTAALPRKYGYGESGLGFVIEVCTIRCTPACCAASNSTRLFSTAT